MYGICLVSCVSVLLITQPYAIARVFTRDEATIDVIVQTLPMLAWYIILSGI